MNKNANQVSGEGEWVYTTCTGCFNACGMKVLRKDNKIVAAKGDLPAQEGPWKPKLCGKAIARITDLYDQNRVTKPLKRTNPEKKLGGDPKWKEISWEEAIDTIVEKLDKIYKEDPRKLIISTFDNSCLPFWSALGEAFGTPNGNFNNTPFCGAGAHTTNFMTVGTLNCDPDMHYSDYIILWGTQMGFGANNNFTVNIHNMVEARKRGAKIVVIDPVCGNAASKADEWVPILPGTDGALALGMMNVIVNDLGHYDGEFLKRRTNAPYLTDRDGHYVRDKESQEPLVWDPVDGAAKTYDADNLNDYALEGVYEVDGAECRPAFELLKENLKKYTPEKVSEITTVPQETIKRIAKEFVEAAKIGETIELDGQTIPFRPACIEFKRGPNSHKNSFHNCYSVMMLNILVGNVDVPGGVLSTNAIGPLDAWKPFKGKDGLFESNIYDYFSDAGFKPPYPPSEVGRPETTDLRALFPAANFLTMVPHYTLNDPDKFCLPYKPEALIFCRTNFLMSTQDPRVFEQTFKHLDFVLGFAWQIDETCEFADILLPAPHDFERYGLFPSNVAGFIIPPGQGKWYGEILQPVVDPPEGVRNWIDVMTEIYDRLGILGKLNELINAKTGLGMSEELRLEPEKQYSVEDICKKQVSLMTQQPYDDALFRQSCGVDFYEKTLEEAYPGAFNDARLFIYFEHFIDLGKQVEKVTQELGMTFWDTSYYHPLPEWHPCPANENDSKGYDLFVVNSKLPLIQHTVTSENPWVDEICQKNPRDHNILMNPGTGKKYGIDDGEHVWLESETNRIKGRVKFSECVHPMVLATHGCLGHWAKKKPIARGKGIHFNSLIKFDWSMVDPISGQFDTCVKVKVYKAGDSDA